MKTLEKTMALLEKFEKQYGFRVAGAQQGSDAWFKTKLGVISASCAKDAVAGKDTETRANYIADLVAQIATGIAEEISSKYLDWGNLNESSARSSYEFSENVEVIELPFVFKDESFRIGCSPDGLTSTRKGVEIKCPYDSANYVRFLTESKIKPEYVYQYQFQLWVLEADKMDFVQYDPRMRANPLHVLEVGRDEKVIAKFEELIPVFIYDMDIILKKAGFSFGDQWLRLSEEPAPKLTEVPA